MSNSREIEQDALRQMAKSLAEKTPAVREAVSNLFYPARKTADDTFPYKQCVMPSLCKQAGCCRQDNGCTSRAITEPPTQGKIMSETPQETMLVSKLRWFVQNIRRKPMPIADLIPLLNEAADALSAAEQRAEAMGKGLSAVSALIRDSHGVAGLHLNGDIAPWSELLTGGRFEEWLLDFDAAIASGAGESGNG